MEDLMTLVKWEQILSFFNQAYYFTRYCLRGVWKVLIATTTIVMTDLLAWVKLVQGLSLYNQA